MHAPSVHIERREALLALLASLHFYDQEVDKIILYYIHVYVCYSV